MANSLGSIADWVSLLSAVAAFVTAVATLVYVRYTFKALKQIGAQTAALKGTLEVAWLGMRFTAVQAQIATLDALRKERHVVYEANADWQQWSQEQKEAVEKVIRAFDVYGFMDRNQFVPRALLHQFYAYPVLRIWSVAHQYIDSVRDPKGRNQPGHMWELEQLKERAKRGPKHPAESGALDWPADTDDAIVRLLKSLESDAP